jgi:hypothetical protein
MIINPYVFGGSAIFDGAATPAEFNVLVAGGPPTFKGPEAPVLFSVDVFRAPNLDNYTTDMWGVWSSVERMLTAYAGSLVRVRRSSDDTEQDFGVASGSSTLDVAALIAWVTATDANGHGYVVKEYDQSGNGNDRSQATATRQPYIVYRGAFCEGTWFEAGRNCGLRTTATVPAVPGHSFFSRGHWRANDSTQGMFVESGDGGETDPFLMYKALASTIYVASAGTAGYSSIAFTDSEVYAAVWNKSASTYSTENVLYKNGASVGSSNINNVVDTGNFSVQEVNFGARNLGAQYQSDMVTRCAVLYTVAKTLAEVQEITTAIKRLPAYVGTWDNIWEPTDLGTSPRHWWGDMSHVVLATGCSSWGDRGTGAVPLSQATGANQPAVNYTGINNRRIVTFDGVNDRLGAADASLFQNVSAGWVMLVSKKTALSTPSTTNQTVFYAGTNTTSAVRLSVLQNHSAGVDKLSVAARRLDADALAVHNGPSIPDTNFHMYLVLMDWSTGNVEIWMDGTQVVAPTALTSAGSTSNTAATDTVIAGGLGATENAPVSIADLIVGRGSLPSSGDIDKLFGYCAHKFGLTALLPGGHAYKTVAP